MNGALSASVNRFVDVISRQSTMHQNLFDEVDVVKEAAVSAAANAPRRRKSAAATASAKSTLLRLESFHNLPDYLRDNE